MLGHGQWKLYHASGTWETIQNVTVNKGLKNAESGLTIDDFKHAQRLSTVDGQSSIPGPFELIPFR